MTEEMKSRFTPEEILAITDCGAAVMKKLEEIQRETQREIAESLARVDKINTAYVRAMRFFFFYLPKSWIK